MTVTANVKYLNVARRYANAIYEILNEKTRNVFNEEGGDFQEAVKGDSKILEFLAIPLVHWEKKLEVLEKCFPKSFKVEEIKNLFTILCKKKRETVLPAVCEVISEKMNAATGKRRCIVTTARPVSKSLAESLLKKLEKKFKKELDLELRVEPGLLAGFRAEVDGITYDATTKNNLNSLRSHVLGSLRN